MKNCTLIVAALAVLPLIPSVAQAQAPSREARVNLRLADQNLEDVVSFLRDRSGANIVVMDREGKMPCRSPR